MSLTEKFARGRASMRLSARLPEGNVVACSGHGEEHGFLVPRLGLSVECPTCGNIALAVDLIAKFYRPPDAATDPQSYLQEEGSPGRLA